jgi:N-acetylglucosaminyldiphosphoundecaprenol N-acetyl-beta-D-mannosaminyltransferase
MNDFDKTFLLGVGFNNLTETEVLEYIVKNLQKQRKKYYIVTPNPELLVIANNDKDYKKVLNGAELALPDGIGIILGSQLLGKSLKQRITGVDFMEMLCKEVSKRPITVSFLGAGPNVAVKTSECLQKRYPGLNVGWVAQEWSEELKNKETDILFVAFGSPKQEIWISEHLNELPVKVAVGVGGAFDFVSGNVRRAPGLMRRLGLEWLFRLVIQPWRIKRQLSLVKFSYLILKEKFS